MVADGLPQTPLRLGLRGAAAVSGLLVDLLGDRLSFGELLRDVLGLATAAATATTRVRRRASMSSVHASMRTAGLPARWSRTSASAIVDLPLPQAPESDRVKGGVAAPTSSTSWATIGSTPKASSSLSSTRRRVREPRPRRWRRRGGLFKAQKSSQGIHRPLSMFRAQRATGMRPRVRCAWHRATESIALREHALLGLPTPASHHRPGIKQKSRPIPPEIGRLRVARDVDSKPATSRPLGGQGRPITGRAMIEGEASSAPRCHHDIDDCTIIAGSAALDVTDALQWRE